MADVIQTIKLNLIDTGIIDTGIRVKQGDSGISFIFDVNYAGKKVFEAGNLPTIVFKRSDGVSIIAECTVDNDNYIYTIVGNELEQAGDLLVDLKFTWGGRESTCTARLYVVPDTIGKDVNPSDVYTNTVTIDDINEGVAKTKQYRDEAEQFRNEAEHFTPTGYQQLVTDVDGMKTSKQDSLVSGQNIKTINGESVLGEGNIEIQGGSGSGVIPISNAEYEALPDKTGAYAIMDAPNVLTVGQVNDRVNQLNSDLTNYLIAEKVTSKPTLSPYAFTEVTWNIPTKEGYRPYKYTYVGNGTNWNVLNYHDNCGLLSANTTSKKISIYNNQAQEITPSMSLIVEYVKVIG